MKEEAKQTRKFGEDARFPVGERGEGKKSFSSKSLTQNESLANKDNLEKNVLTSKGKSGRINGGKWRPDLTRSQLLTLMERIRKDVKSSNRSVTDTANWMVTKIDGVEVFAIYSTENANDPTLLFESKGNATTKDIELLLYRKELESNGRKKSVFGRASTRNGNVSDRNGGFVPNTDSGRSQNSNTNIGERDASILRGYSPTGEQASYGRRALGNVLDNLFEAQERRDSVQRESRQTGRGSQEESQQRITESDRQTEESLQANDVVVSDGVASFTPERFNDLIETYSTNSGNKNYSKGYVAYISPSDFLALTTTNEELIVSQAKEQYNELDVSKLASSRTTPFLKIDFNDKGKSVVVGHEGRHRMALLRDAGVNKVAIAIENSDEKNNAKKRSNVVVKGQSFGRSRAKGEVVIDEIVPLSLAYRDEVREKFVDNKSGVKYSKGLPNGNIFEEKPKYKHLYNEETVSADFINSVNPTIENAILNIRNGNIDAVPNVIDVAQLSEKTVKMISDFVGFDVSDYSCKIERDRLEHIENRHGIKGEHDRSLSDPKDTARMGYVINNGDNIEWVVDENGNRVYDLKYNDRYNKKAPIFAIVKRIDGTYVVSQVVPDSKKKTLWITSARIAKIAKTAVGSQVPNTDNSPLLTSKTPLVSSSVFDTNYTTQNQSSGGQVVNNSENDKSTIATDKKRSGGLPTSPNETTTGTNASNDSADIISSAIQGQATNFIDAILSTKKEMNGKYQVGSGRVVAVTHDIPFTDTNYTIQNQSSGGQVVNNSENNKSTIATDKKRSGGLPTSPNENTTDNITDANASNDSADIISSAIKGQATNFIDAILSTKKEMNGKYQVGSGRVVTVTHDTPFTDTNYTTQNQISGGQSVNEFENNSRKASKGLTHTFVQGNNKNTLPINPKRKPTAPQMPSSEESKQRSSAFVENAQTTHSKPKPNADEKQSDCYCFSSNFFALQALLLQLSQPQQPPLLFERKTIIIATTTTSKAIIM